jgi:hypothetical protein
LFPTLPVATKSNLSVSGIILSDLSKSTKIKLSLSIQGNHQSVKFLKTFAKFGQEAVSLVAATP